MSDEFTVDEIYELMESQLEVNGAATIADKDGRLLLLKVDLLKKLLAGAEEKGNDRVQIFIKHYVPPDRGTLS